MENIFLRHFMLAVLSVVAVTLFAQQPTDSLPPAPPQNQQNNKTQQMSQRPPFRGQGPRGKRGHARLTVDSLNTYMTATLGLTDKQLAKVKKLNSSYADIIEGQTSNGKSKGNAPQGRSGMGGPGGGMGGHGGGMGGPSGGMGGHGGGMGGPGGGMGGPGGGFRSSQSSSSSSEDLFSKMEKRETKYEKKLRKILSDSQYAGYEKIKPSFASQRMYRDFLLNGQMPFSSNNSTPPAKEKEN